MIVRKLVYIFGNVRKAHPSHSPERGDEIVQCVQVKYINKQVQSYRGKTSQMSEGDRFIVLIVKRQGTRSC